MPIQWSWTDEQHQIFYIKCHGVVTLDEWLHVIDEMDSVLSAIDYVVPAIVDFSDAAEVPAYSLGALVKVIRYADQHPQKGAVILVSMQRALKMLTLQVIRMFPPKTLYFTDTIEEAKEKIAVLYRMTTN